MLAESIAGGTGVSLLKPPPGPDFQRGNSESRERKLTGNLPVGTPGARTGRKSEGSFSGERPGPGRVV